MTGQDRKSRQHTEIAERRDRVADLYLKGVSQPQVAREMGVTQATISRDLCELRKLWVKNSVSKIDERKALELAKVDLLELTYWEAWERSLEEYKSRTVKGPTNASGSALGPLERTMKTEDRNGDPRYLQGVQWCIEKRCDILELGRAGATAGGKQQVEVTLKVVYGNKRTDSPPG